MMLRNLGVGLCLGLSGFLCSSVGGKEAIAPVPVSDLFRTYNYLFPWMAMSPDGRTVSSVFFSEWERLHFPALASVDVETGKSSILHLNWRIHVYDVEWAGPNRMLLTAYGLNSAAGWQVQMGLFSFDGNGERSKVIVKPGSVSALLGTLRKDRKNRRETVMAVRPPSVVTWQGLPPDEVLVAQRKIGDRYERARRWANDGAVPLPGVYRVNLVTGKYSLQVADPGWTEQWFADPEGRVRVASGYAREGFTDVGRMVDNTVIPARRVYWLNDDGRAEEVTAINLGPDEEFLPLGFEQGGKRFLFSGREGRDRAAIYAYDHEANSVEGPLVENPNVEVTSAILSPHDQTVAGVRLHDGLPKVVWLDPELRQLQRSVDAALPGTYNEIQQWTENYQRSLILASAPHDAGRYFLLDRATGSMVELFDRAPWLANAKFGATESVTFAARDGVPLHGYLTRPPGAPKGQRTPLVLLVHGGPWTVRDRAEFQPEVQFYATRGYAVLQVNYRFSEGYGRNHVELGRKQLGGTMQADLDDAVEWAIAQGIADPECLLIAGASYGGYASLMGVIGQPTRFRAAVAMFPVTDWVQQIVDVENDAKKAPWNDQHAFNLAHNKREVGDPATERRRLEEISPLYHVSKIQVPVFLVYGPEDEVIDKRQVKNFIAKMRAEKKSLVHFAPRDEGHGLSDERRRLKVYTELEKFLEEHAPVR